MANYKGFIRHKIFILSFHYLEVKPTEKLYVDLKGSYRGILDFGSLIEKYAKRKGLRFLCPFAPTLWNIILTAGVATTVSLSDANFSEISKCFIHTQKKKIIIQMIFHLFSCLHLTRLKCLTVCRTNLRGSWEFGGEPAELDQRQSEPPHVHRAHREVRPVQKPTGKRLVAAHLHTLNTSESCSSFLICFPSAAELFAGAEGDVRDGREEQRSSVRGGLVLPSLDV